MSDQRRSEPGVDVTPSMGLRTSALSPAEIALEGRVIQTWNSAISLGVLVFVTLALWFPVWRQQRWWEAGWLRYLPASLLITQVLALGFRIGARRAASRHERTKQSGSEAKQSNPGAEDCTPTQATKDQGPLGGLVIACSGGGIKSASFCLGALQRLGNSEYLSKATHLLGVSGGGYIAAAYAALAHRRNEAGYLGPPFQPNSAEVDVLRARSDYISNSSRVRHNLTATLIGGAALHVLMLLALTRIVAWVIAEHTLLTQATSAAGGWTKSSIWLLDPSSQSLWITPLTLIPCSIAVFLLWRGIEPTRYTGKLPSPRRWVPRGRRGYVLAWFIASLPGLLLLSAVGYLVLFGVVPWTAAFAHNALLDAGGSLVHGVGVMIAGLITGLASVKMLVASTIKGVQTLTEADRLTFATVAESPTREHWWTPVLLRFRRHLAPVVGLFAVAMVLLGTLIAIVAIDLWAGLPHTEANDPVPPFYWWTSPWAALAFLVGLRLVRPAHLTSLLPFYRDRLSFAFLEVPAGGEHPSTPTSRADPGSQLTALTLGDLAKSRAVAEPAASVVSEGSAPERAPSFRVPQLYLCATANIKDAHLLPVGRSATPFAMTTSGVGFTDQRLPGGICHANPSAYLGGRLSLADAVAVSGAAISPLAGRDNRLIGSARILLALANVRLGMWVPNPYWTKARLESESTATATPGQRILTWVNDLMDHTSPLHVLSEAVGVPSVYHPYVYVTDGGHYDNLGLVESLRLRPDRIILLDGSGDPEDTFSAMGIAMATARMDLGVEIDFNPEKLTRGSSEHAKAGWTTMTATYPDQQTCCILYVKSVWSGDVSWDVRSYRLAHPGFPVVSDELEAYTEFDLESFRMLGWTYVDQALAQLT